MALLGELEESVRAMLVWTTRVYHHAEGRWYVLTVDGWVPE